MKIYTKTGDKGKTSLLSGERVAKNDPRLKAYGEVDELNSVIGALIAQLPESLKDIADQLKQIQSDLFDVGAWLAATPDSAVTGRLMPVGEERAEKLEAYIDTMQAALPELKSFIVPGGHISAGWAHIARTVCRRAERSTLDLADHCKNCEAHRAALAPVQVFLNRLSDYLFSVARACNQAVGVPDVVWKPNS
jgi:cob(I)alamin adenosyltransferase